MGYCRDHGGINVFIWHDGYGPPKAVSNNGRIYIFKKKGDKILNIMNLSLKGLQLVKKIDLGACIQDYFLNYDQSYNNDDDLKE